MHRQPARRLCPKDKTGQEKDSSLQRKDFAEIAEVAPIQLKPPVSPETAADLAQEKNASDKVSKRKYCFIATAAYGSPLAQEVVLLKTYRDNYLAQHVVGEKFIQAYYRYSPYLARQVSRNKVLKLLTRCLLTPLIFLIKKISGNPGN